jgi:phosphatidylserine/phosphatidylglycerophosphate/cardiolipin synthase-like enzyme
MCFVLTAPVEARRHKDTLNSFPDDSLAAAQTALPKDLEVCFSPDERCDLKLIRFVDSATTSLEIAIFDINLGTLVNHIIAQSKKIPVRMVVDRKQSKTGRSAVPKLLEAGVKLRFGSQRGIMHNKFVIVDRKMMETGSFNQTHGAAFSNNENQIYLANPKVLEAYGKRFDLIWNQGK